MSSLFRLKFFAVASVSVLTVVLAFVSGTGEVQANSITPRQVAEKFDHVLRKSHKTAVTLLRMSTCRYSSGGEGITCAERPRVSGIEYVLKFHGDDIRSVAVILHPISDKGTVSLKYEYYDVGKDNDVWIYLPVLDKVKRIVLSTIVLSTLEGGNGAFFGSEFDFEDLDYRKLNDYTYKILSEEDIRVEEKKGPTMRPAWVLEWKPTAQHALKTRYSRVVTWIDRERNILLKEQYFSQDSSLLKERTIRDLEFADNHWRPRQIMMNNLQAKRVSTMDLERIAYDFDVSDEFFTLRVLTDFAFRERNMSEIRMALK